MEFKARKIRHSEVRARQWTKGEKGYFTRSISTGGGSNSGLTNGENNGNIQSSSKQIGKNGGTLKAEDLPSIKLLDGMYKKADPGTIVNRIYTFAGKGTNKALRVEDALVKKFGGTKGQWQHTTGDVSITVKNLTRTAEVHWFQEPSVGIVNAKFKRWR